MPPHGAKGKLLPGQSAAFKPLRPELVIYVGVKPPQMPGRLSGQGDRAPVRHRLLLAWQEWKAVFAGCLREPRLGFC